MTSDLVHGSNDSGEQAAVGAIRNPLWVISLFLGLCQTVAGTVTALTAGFVQVIFAIFVVSYPILIAAAFFSILWWRPLAFYAPRDYAKNVAPSEMAEALSLRSTKVVEVAMDVARESVEEAADSLVRENRISRSDRDEIAQKGNERVREAFKNRSIHVSLDDFGPYSVDLLVADDSTVNDLLNDIFFRMRDLGIKIQAYTYGTTWLLQDASNGALLREMGGDWAKVQTGTRDDRRTLDKVGLKPGSELRVVDLRPASERAR